MVRVKGTLLLVLFGIKIKFWFVWHMDPWFKRGGDHNNGTSAGVSAFATALGMAHVDGSFRVVLFTMKNNC